MFQIICTQFATDGFLFLCDLLDTELNYRVGGERNRREYQNLNKLDNIRNFYTVYCEEEAIGCACIKEYNIDSLEIKRLYVKEQFRNNGIAKKLLKQIISDAIIYEYKSLILETGKPLYEALNLYKKLGFITIPNYGPYMHLKYSICMKKIIGDNNETI